MPFSKKPGARSGAKRTSDKRTSDKRTSENRTSEKRTFAGKERGERYSDERPKPRRRPKYYQPRTFMGANSETEERRLAEWTGQRIALEVLHAFEETQERADILLRTHIQRHLGILDSRDREQIARTALNVIRYKLRLDYVVSKTLKRNAEELEPLIRCIYRLAAFHIVHLGHSVERTQAIVNFIVPKSYGNQKESLRNFISHLKKYHTEISFPNPRKQPVEALAITYSHPSWLIEKWSKTYGAESTVRMCEFDNQETPLVLRINTLKATEADVFKKLKAEGIIPKKTAYAQYGLIPGEVHDIFNRKIFKDGWVEVQAESSQIFCEWVNPASEDRVLDACAGGGGKSLALSMLMRNTGHIVAADINAGALEQLKKRATRAGCKNIEVIENDALAVLNQRGTWYDKIIIDAPCSGLGVLQRNPDMRWRVTQDNIEKLVNEQRTLLENYAPLVKPGGMLIYATCTLSEEENENVIEAFLSAHPEFELQKNHDARWKKFISGKGYFCITPFEHNISGFFSGKLIRRKN